MSYSKGPWRWDSAYVVDSDDIPVASVNARGSFSESEANAKLIAAAPTMLTALKAARDAIEICMKHGTPWAQIDTEIIDAAIQQAEGGE